jgi:hypothetical protein
MPWIRGQPSLINAQRSVLPSRERLQLADALGGRRRGHAKRETVASRRWLPENAGCFR